MEQLTVEVNGHLGLEGHNNKKPPKYDYNSDSQGSTGKRPSEKVRVRSASTGRDKKSELQARYWAFLFGNLENCINEIYQTVEYYENLSSCQETILVLENHIKDFRALAKWFRVSWDYDSTPKPDRPLSLAWEVRKSNPGPKVRSKNLSSPVLSGKSSPSYSGKNSPCPPIAEHRAYGRNGPTNSEWQFVHLRNSIHANELRAGPRPERKSPERSNYGSGMKRSASDGKLQDSGIETPSEMKEPDDYIQLPENKRNQHCQTYLDDDHLELAAYRKKYNLTFSLKPEIEEKDEKNQVSPKEVKLNGPEKVEDVEKENKSPDSILEPVKEKPILTSSIVKKLSEEKKEAPIVPKYSVVLSKNITTSKVATPKKPTFTHSMTNNVIPNLKSVNSSVKQQPTFQVRKSLSQSQVKSNYQRPVTVPISGKANVPLNKKPRNSVVPSNVERRISVRSNTMIEMKKHSSFSTAVRFPKKHSQEDLNSSTSTLKASNERINQKRAPLKGSDRNISNRKSEPKTLPSSNQNQETSNDGWLTVKSKRRSSLHWANRFNQPTGYASLPTLALLDEQQEEDSDKINPKKNPKKVNETTKPLEKKPIKPKEHPTKFLTSKDSKSKTMLDLKQPAKVPSKVNILTKKGDQKPQIPNKTNVVRQKSDLTGLKIKSLHREYMRIEKLNEKKSEKTKLERNLEESLEEDDLNAKVDMNIQTAMLRKPDKIINLSSCDEMEDKDLEESDEDQKKLLEEQENLERQIRELENTEIDVDTETDETDCEVLIDNDDEGSDQTVKETNDEQSQTAFDENTSLETKYHLLLSEISMAERLQTLETLQAFVARHPGRAQELHQKLSSPSRRRSLHETLKKYQVKQARAQEKRNALQKEKASKLQLLLTRVEDVKVAKQQLIDEKRQRMEDRLQRAAENRSQFLKDKVKKAHDEDEKLREIAFIKSLTAQNKRLDLLESSKEHEGRLQDLEQERQKRVEEKAAKEAAAERRRLELEQERQRRLEKMNEKRTEREKRVGKMQEQKERERQAIAREKAKEREERLQALQAQQQATTEELQRKINQKLQESTRRHEENIEHIRQRAQELGIPSRPVEEGSVSDLSSTVSDVLEPNKSSRKKLKKLKQKLAEQTEQYLSELPPLQSHHRRDSEVPKIMSVINKGGGPQGYERPLGQLLRLVSKAQAADFHCLLSLDALGAITKVIKDGTQPNSDITRKAVIMAVQLYRNVCSVCPQITRHAILGNTITNLLDVLFTSFQQPPEENKTSMPVEIDVELILACTVALSSCNSLKNTNTKVMERLPDVISYSVLIGLVDTLAKRCAKIKEPVEQHQAVVLSLLATLGLLTKFAQICPKGPGDPTRYLSTAKQTELFGVITLLHSTIIPIDECIPPRTISLAAATFNLLVTLADLDLHTYQSIISDGVILLKYLDVVTVLLKYCGPKSGEKGETQSVIIDLIGTLGFFCVNNRKNQNLLTSEQKMVILKSVIKLPTDFQVAIYPTLAAVVWKNQDARRAVSAEFDVDSLDEYQASALAKRNKLICLLK